MNMCRESFAILVTDVTLEYHWGMHTISRNSYDLGSSSIITILTLLEAVHHPPSSVPNLKIPEQVYGLFPSSYSQVNHLSEFVWQSIRFVILFVGRRESLARSPA